MDQDLRGRLETSVISAMEAALVAPMRWGVDDCALWYANIIRDALGYDPGAEFRGKYDTREGAYEVLGAAGLVYRCDGIAQKWGWKRITPQEAKVGDPGFIRFSPDGQNRQISVAVCRAPGWFVARNEAGVTALPAKFIRCVSSILP